uniref:Putative secreted protein n=1 Tax=Anopheles marajoara TaxID=58244 RepID=A0A2M4CAB6_9DIPT
MLSSSLASSLSLALYLLMRFLLCKTLGETRREATTIACSTTNKYIPPLCWERERGGRKCRRCHQVTVLSPFPSFSPLQHTSSRSRLTT